MNPFKTKDPLQETVEGVLTEALDKPYPWKIVQDQKDFLKASFVNGSKDRIDVTFISHKSSKDDELSWNIAFEGAWGYERSGRGDEFRTFATILDVIFWFLKDRKPKFVEFNAQKENKDDVSRERLYDRLVKKYSTKAGYDYQISKRRVMTIYYFTRRD
jgi:hypothetical protein